MGGVLRSGAYLRRGKMGSGCPHVLRCGGAAQFFRR
nr:MAG TPA: hypothetical protein [Caudoviricetes sp.]